MIESFNIDNKIKEKNNGEIQSKFTEQEIKKLKSFGLSSTLERIAKIEKEHQQISQEGEKTDNWWKLGCLENKLKYQHDYIREVCRAVEYKDKKVNHAKVGDNAEWKTILKWLKKQNERKLTEKQDKLLRYKLFSLINREKVKKEILKEMGKLGEIINYKKLGILPSFSEGGFFDACDEVCYYLRDYEAKEITEKAVNEKIKSVFIAFLVNEVKEIVNDYGGNF